TSWVLAPSTCRALDVASSTVTADALGGAPLILFATTALTTNSSPGAAKYGACGWITKSPCDTTLRSATPIAVSVTATAITRIVPLKESGTGTSKVPGLP